MKKLLLLAILFQLNAFAQMNRNLVIISGTNEPVNVIINGQIINHKPLHKIRIKSLFENYYNITVNFAHQPNLRMNVRLYLPPLSEIVYEVYPPDRRNPQGDFIINNIYPIDNQIPYFRPGTIFTYASGISSTGQNPGGNMQNGQINININNNAINQGTSGNGQVVYVPDYAGTIGCTPPVTPERFKNMMQAVRNQNFEDGKLRVAKQIIKLNYCMTVNQLVQILRLFDFDESKLKLAKFAYHYVYDIENFYKVNNVFDFESNAKKLDRYINQQY
jgi:hypothetical protein